MTTKSTLYEAAILKFVVPLLVLAVVGTFTWLLASDRRLTVLEVRGETISEDVKEIKADVKKLLEGPR